MGRRWVEPQCPRNCLRGMRAFGLAGLVLLSAAGCFGGSSATSKPIHAGDSSHAIADAVRWTISYGVGQERPYRTQVSPCPTGAACKVVQDPRTTFSATRRHGWARIAIRHLACPSTPESIRVIEQSKAASGDYVDPARACQAIWHLQAILRKMPATVCSCPLQMNIEGKATAVVNGSRAKVPLDFCTYCGSGSPTAGTDLTTLQPQT